MEKGMKIMYNRRIMAERKTYTADVAKMEETLDLIDISLYDLLVKRAEIVGRIDAVRPPSVPVHALAVRICQENHIRTQV